MNLPFFSRNKNKKDYYLGIFLKEEEGTLMLMDSTGGSIEIREKENFNYSNGWENLVSDIDEVLYRFEKKVNTNIDKTIFFVYSHLVDEKAGDIKQPYLQKIKELVKNLELTALGYIECYEAVSKFLHSKEEMPLTGILIEMDRHDLTIFIYKGGSISHKRSVARTDNIAEDLINGISDLKGKFLLPSRIILYDSHDLDSSVEKILSYRWDEQYFIQLPRVDMLKEEDVTTGLVNVFAEQIGSRKVVAVEAPQKTDEETFGFLINQDVSQVKETVAVSDTTTASPETVRQPLKLPVFDLPKMGFKIPKINLSFLSGKWTVLAGVLIILTALTLNEYFFHKAELKVYLNSNKIEKSSTFDIDYKIATSSASYTEDAATTGSRQIGDPARGQVTLHNFDDGERTFAKGTLIEGAGLKFALDTEVKVASSSLASDGSAKLPGKNTGSVTAAVIGAEGNLAKGTRFSIADLSSSIYFAINESPFSGGNKRSVRTVSAKDQEDLEKSILEEAKKQMTPPKGVSGGLLTSLTQTTLTETTYSKEVGEESNNVELKARARATFFLYDRNELVDKIISVIGKDVKSGFQIERSLVNYKINKATLTDKEIVKVDLDIDANSVKKIDEKEIAGMVLGKHKNSLNNLKEKLDIQGYDLKIEEPIPILSDFLPFFKNNINIIVTTL